MDNDLRRNYLAYKLAANPEQNFRIILLDRSLSIERASLLYDTSKRALWEAKSNILGYKIDGEPIDMNELTLARHFVCNERLGLPPPRADYIRYAIIDLLKRKGSLLRGQILAEFGIKDEKITLPVKRLDINDVIVKCNNQAVEITILKRGMFLNAQTKYSTLNVK